MNIISTESQKLLNLYEQMLIQHQQRGINGLNQMPMQNYHQSQLSLQIKSSLQNTSSSSSSHTSSNASSNSSLCSSKSQQSSPSNSSQSPPPQPVNVNKSSTPTQPSYPSTSNLDAFSAENSYRAYMAAALAAAAAAASNSAAAATFPYQFIQSQQQQQNVVANQLEYANNGYSYVANNNSNRLTSKPSQMQVSNNVQLNQPRSNTVTSSSFKARSSLGSSVGSSSSSSGGGGGGNGLEEPPKPAHSYIGLIAIAILSSPEKRLVLSDIYQYILDNYSYFHNRGSGWRNSIRHNLSLNDCFMKSGRSANGKGHYWSIHPANMADFSSGDFRRRRAQRRVRKSMGLSVPDDEEDDDEVLPVNGNDHPFEHPLAKFPSDELRPNVTDLSLSSSSSSSTTTANSTGVTPTLLQRYFDDMQRAVASRLEQQPHGGANAQVFFPSPPQSLNTSRNPALTTTATSTPLRPLASAANQRKRCFDVDSLLAPEQPCLIKRRKSSLDGNDDTGSPDSKSDGSTDTDISA